MSTYFVENKLVFAPMSKKVQSFLPDMSSSAN